MTITAMEKSMNTSLILITMAYLMLEKVDSYLYQNLEMHMEINYPSLEVLTVLKV